MGWFNVGRFSFVASCLILAAASSRAQNALAPEIASKVDEAMESAIPSGELRCQTRTIKPFLDFALRFEAGFVVSCRLAQFGGNPTKMGLYVRIAAENGKRSVLGEGFAMPALRSEKRGTINWKHFREEVEVSGAFAVGEGNYKVDLLLVDESGRVHRKSWPVKVEARGKEKSVEPGLAANTVMALSGPVPWAETARTIEADAAGRNNLKRVTVFLDAAPLVPSALTLRAWDRAFLLGSLASLLRQVGPAQVRLIAFNLDQQREIFRTENLDKQGFHKLNGALQALELGTVSYHTLQRDSGWADLLVKLVNDETSASDPSDAVIFLGPNLRILDKVAPDYVRAREDIGQRLYYFEYFAHIGYEFPDAIHQLTNACRGTVFKLHSPADFAASIAKLQRRLDTDSATP